jgi:hypothetical protein
MNRLLTIIVLIVIFHHSYSQPDLRETFKEQNRITRTGMYVLGGWAAGNLVINSGLLLGNPEGQSRYFNEMNIYWNLVNAGLAGLSLIHLKKINHQDLNVSYVIKRQKRLENILLLNAGLDIAYMVGGFYLRELGKNEKNNQELLTGFGNSLVLQGGFLLIFDTILYLAHSQHANKWLPLLNKLQISHNSIGLRFNL